MFILVRKDMNTIPKGILMSNVGYHMKAVIERMRIGLKMGKTPQDFGLIIFYGNIKLMMKR